MYKYIISISLLVALNSNAQHSTYYIGHSGFGWDLIVGEMVNDLAADANITTYDYGYQFIGGTCLSSQWNNHATPQGGTDSWQELPNGYDVVVLAEQIPIQEVIYSSPWGCDLTSVQSVTNFYNLATQGNPNPRMYLMEFHNEVDLTGPTPYSTWAQMNADMRPLWEQVADSVELINSGSEVCIIPVATAFQALADSVIEGSFPELTNWVDIFDSTDIAVATIHPTEMTYYLVACVHYACIFGQSPEGLTNETFAAGGWAFDPPTPEQALMMQQIAWETVSNDAYACLTTNSVNEFNGSGTKIYPNPSKGSITINSENTIYKIDIHGLTGSLVQSIEENLNGNINFNLQPGTYLVQVTTNSGVYQERLIIY